MGLRKIYTIFLAVLFCIGNASAAVRNQNTISRPDTTNVSARNSSNTKSVNATRSTTTRASTTNNNSNKKVATRKTTARNTTKKIITSRPNTTRSAVAARSAQKQKRASRAAVTTATKTFGDNYTTCRDSYFTCMDQFCATQNETYRRCVCSSQLKNIQNKEQLLSQTATNLQNFQDFNIDAISKTSAEVKSMQTASEGEASIKKDTSASAKTLNNISAVLNDSKQQYTSNNQYNSELKSVWSTTDLISGTDIANMTGESLYNAVNAQCSALVAQDCAETDIKMIASAYGMYIENDCSVLASNIDAKMTNANAAIRSTRYKMQDARLENYNAHNSLSLNDCIASVRKDLTASHACGENYVHCLDVTGRYLNIDTGEPIYSVNFYDLENQISLSGDILRTAQNSPYVSVLNKKREFANQSLDLCVDDADVVWDEFLRQALVEISQRQKQRVHDVKNECLDVVNKCYLEKTQDLKVFSDNSSDISLGQVLEVSEDMCAEKLNTCSNLYGGGTDGLYLLVNTMSNITDQTIAQTCPDLLDGFLQNVCSVSTKDSLHSYPYGCRAYAPGEPRYARVEICNTTLTNPFSRSNIVFTKTENLQTSDYVCKDAVKHYTSCSFNYYLYHDDASLYQHCGYNNQNEFELSQNFCPKVANECRICPDGFTCLGGTNKPISTDQDLYASCGVDYIGSLYQQLVRYALQNCIRPSLETNILPESVLGDVDTAMRKVQSALMVELSKECINLEGKWVDIPWKDDNGDGRHDSTGDELMPEFYSTTGANKLWGYCTNQ